MAGNLINRYLWLADILTNKGPIPFVEISKLWFESEYNPKQYLEGLPKKTFHNHCRIISELFGVNVCCEEGGNYGYYLEELAYSERWKKSFLDEMLKFNTIKSDPKLSERIRNFDTVHKDIEYQMIRLMKDKRAISFVWPNHNLQNWPLSHNEWQTISDEEINEMVYKLGIKYNHFIPLSFVQADFHVFVIGLSEEGRFHVFWTDHMERIVEEGVISSNVADSFSLSSFLKNLSIPKKPPQKEVDDVRLFFECYHNSRLRVQFGGRLEGREKIKILPD